MIQITPQMRILVAVEPGGFSVWRIDGSFNRRAGYRIRLALACSCSATGRRRALVVLVYDGQGLVVLRCLSSGRFQWWPKSATAAAKTLVAHQLHVLFSAGDPGSNPGGMPAWRAVTPVG